MHIYLIKEATKKQRSCMGPSKRIDRPATISSSVTMPNSFYRAFQLVSLRILNLISSSVMLLFLQQLFSNSQEIPRKWNL
jgi:hypothetical protein